MGLAVVLILIGVIWFLLDKYLLSYWSRHGFKQFKPTFFIGNMGKFLAAKESTPQIFEDFYYKSKPERFIGMYNFYKPSLLITDPELIHNIMIKDFAHFHDHAIMTDVENDPLSGHLFSLTGQKWRDLRVRLSPAFTSGKLRWMFPVVKDCSDVLVKFVEKTLKNDENILNANEIFRRYSSNVISSVAFGIDNDCINEPNNDFYKFGIKFFEPSFRNLARSFLFQFLPGIMKLFKVKFAPEDVDAFVIKMVKEIVDYRETNNFKRNDFMDMLIQLKDRGYVTADKDIFDDDDEKKNFEDEIEHNSLKKFTFEELAAQAFVFFLAAFETNSGAMTFCLFEIAKNPRIQQKLQDEIDQELANGEMTYETIKNLKYLDCCLLEALRKYAPVAIHMRECTKDYKIPDSDLIIRKGTDIKIPIMAIHRDPEIFENPLEFKPERFINSQTGNADLDSGRSKIFYSPFGDGPRHCIGK